MAPEVLRNEPSNEKWVYYTHHCFLSLSLIVTNVLLFISIFSAPENQVRRLQFWSDIVGTCNRKNPLGYSQCNAGTVFMCTLSVSSLAGIYMNNSFSIFLQVIGAVGFMNHRLEIPENVDPQWASIIESCWHTCDFFKLWYTCLMTNFFFSC